MERMNISDSEAMEYANRMIRELDLTLENNSKLDIQSKLNMQVFRQVLKKLLKLSEKGDIEMKTVKKVVDEDTLEIKEVEVDEKNVGEDMYSYFSLRDKIANALGCTSEEFHKKYKNYIEAEAEFKEIYEPFKEKLLELYKENPEIPNTLSIANVKLTYISPSTRSTIDSKKLKEEEPEIAKKFTKTTDVNATIRLGGIIENS